MAERANPPAAARSDGEGDRAESAQRERERYGRLDVDRHVKDDGRSLILYIDVSGEQA